MPEQVKPRPTRRGARWIAIAVIAALIAGGALWWQSLSQAVPEVRVEVATLGPVSRVLAVNGKIAARESVLIRSAVSGTVTELLVAEGDSVTSGALLARLDDRQQQAVVLQAKSALEQGRTQQALAAATYGRDRDLGAIIARSRLEEAQLALEGAAQDVARLAALLDQATIQLSRFTVLAAMSGTILTRSVDPGQLVDPTTPLFALADVSVLLVETDVDEAYATQIALGQPATLQLVGQRETLAGAVSFVSPRVDPATGGLAVKIGFDSPVRAPVGLTVTANIVVDARNALTVPRTALQGGAVYVLRADRAVRTPVAVIDWPAARLIVTEGLAEGDKVIVDSTGLTDSLAVRQAAP